MCGIVGAVSAQPIDPGVLAGMGDRLAHRGPDARGLWLAPDSRVGFAFRRLAIIDLSEAANQPFFSHDRRFVIVFNGEIYNFRGLRAELAGLGVPFRTQSDTEVLVEAFRRWGDRCVDRLSGMFAFAVWDTERRRLFCARDRAGEKPFYHALIGDSFVFASELKALVAWPGFRAELHYPALVDFLSFGFVVDPKTIWEGCRKLPAGHGMVVETSPAGSPLVREPSAYWDLEFDPDDSVGDWGAEIRGALEAAAEEMAHADVPIGTFLSGGVDSSAVTAALSRAGRSVHTFTVGFDEPEFDERRWAREVARRYGTRHTETVVAPEDVALVFEKLLWHYDEPFNDYSYLPTFYVCREARKTITVALSGDGGDEVFAGYTKYQRLGLRQDLQPFVSWPIARALLGVTDRLLPAASPLRRTLSQHVSDARSMMLDMVTLGFPLPELRRAARGRLAEALDHYTPMDAVEPILHRAPPEEVGLVNAMRYLDLKLTLGGDILVKVDRASMAVSLEVRPVFLNRRVLDVAKKIPPRLLADRRQAKKALKTALRPWLPDSILNRPKMGFALPLRRWIESQRNPLATAKRAASPIDEMLDGALLETLGRRHVAGERDETSRIHSLVLLERWLSFWPDGVRS